MLEYSIKVKDKANVIFENSTEQEIISVSDFKNAKEIMRNLNMGGGFDGFTPPFFTINYETPIIKD
jgi:hypothetical protein